jgi:hypothetical protein
MTFRSRRSLLLCAAFAVVAAVGVSAHHSFDAEYDSKRPITVTGYVTKLDWINPHAYVYLDVKDAGRPRTTASRWVHRTRWCEADGSATRSRSAIRSR